MTQDRSLAARGRRIAWLPPAMLAMAIFLTSSFPLPDMRSVVEHQDKAMHFAAYAALGLLTCRAALKSSAKGSRLRAFVFSVLIVAAYGASDELHQFLVPTRSPDALDWAADAVGGALGSAAYVAVLMTTGGGRKGDD